LLLKEDVKSIRSKNHNKKNSNAFIGLIGPGGKVIQNYKATGTTIVINEDPTY
jgi:hypothetical protein